MGQTPQRTADIATPPPAAAPDRRYMTRVLLSVTAVALMINYVETMVIPGVPTIQKDFATTATVASWITSAFLIVGSAASPLFGKFGDIYGKKKMFLVALVFYTFGVGIAGFSPSIYFLLAARAIQGVGFAIIPIGLAIIADVFPRERIAAAQGIISATFAIGAAVGLILGSYVVQDFGWQYAFHTAFILSVALLIMTAKILRKDVPGVKRSVDYLGAGILMAGVSLLLVYATEGPTIGWLSAENLAFVIPGIVLTVLFFFFENGRKEPLIALSLLRIRNVLVANLVGIVSGMAMFMLFFALVYYAQVPSPYGLGLGIIATGLTLGPATFVMLAVGPLAGRATARLGPRPMLFIGTSALIAGLLLFTFNRATTLDVTLDMVVSLGGIVSTIIPMVNMITIGTPRENVAVGLGMNTMLRNLGGAIGPVVATAVMTTYTAPLIVQSQVVGEVPTSTAFNIVFGIGVALTLVAFVLSAAVRNYTFRSQGAVGEPSPAAH